MSAVLRHSVLSRNLAPVLVLWWLSSGGAFSQLRETGFAFEGCIEPHAGILAGAPYRGWAAGVGVGYKITPEYSIWLSALSGPVRRFGRVQAVGSDARDDFGMLRISVRRGFPLDSALSLAPLAAFRISTFLLPDGATIGGSGIEVGLGVTAALSEFFEAGGECAYTYDSYHHRSGNVPVVASFSGEDLALRLLIRFHPAISLRR